MTGHKARKLFGERIRRLRKAKKVSQETLAELSNLHSTHIGIIERSEQIPKLDTIVKIANALKVPVKELFTFAPDNKDDLQNEINDLLAGKSQKILKRILEVIKTLSKY